MAGKGQGLYKRAKGRIPGGTQLLSKRPEMFLPDQWPSYYRKAKGVEVWDLDGNKYTDMGYCAIGACVLGCADEDVDYAVKAAIESGAMCTLNCPEEIELADLLCELHPWSDMVRYARSGGEALSVAIRIARARTGRDKIAFCGYHGWHDWYLAANLAEEDSLDGHLLPGLEPAGVPRGLLKTALPFQYNVIDDLKAIVAAYPDEFAAIVLEPVRHKNPKPGFLEEIRDIASRVGAVLIFDEVTSGWRLNTGGIHLLYGVDPDMAVFAKGISNGYPMGAVIGTENVMQAAQNSFISSTAWTERIGPAAALATIRKHQRCNVPEHLVRIGECIQDGWKLAAKQTDISIAVSGIPPLSHFSFEGYGNSQELHTLFNQFLLQEGFLATKSFYATYAHQDQHVTEYLRVVEDAFKLIAEAIDSNNVGELIKGPVAHTGFRRLN